MNPAPASSTIVSAISVTMSARVHRRTRSPPVPPRAPSLSTAFTSVFETCSAGTRPKMIPVARQTAAMKAKTVSSIVNSIQYGLPTLCVAASNHRTPATARPKPAMPAMSASMTLSTSNCRTTRHRLAPSATRTEISCVRCADRASKRLATFAQAISSTKATAPCSARKISRIGPLLARSLYGIRVGVMFSFVAGYAWARR